MGEVGNVATVGCDQGEQAGCAQVREGHPEPEITSVEGAGAIAARFGRFAATGRACAVEAVDRA